MKMSGENVSCGRAISRYRFQTHIAAAHFVESENEKLARSPSVVQCVIVACRREVQQLPLRKIAQVEAVLVFSKTSASVHAWLNHGRDRTYRFLPRRFSFVPHPG